MLHAGTRFHAARALEYRRGQLAACDAQVAVIDLDAAVAGKMLNSSSSTRTVDVFVHGCIAPHAHYLNHNSQPIALCEVIKLFPSRASNIRYRLPYSRI
jgi:hypothetical protein